MPEPSALLIYIIVSIILLQMIALLECLTIIFRSIDLNIDNYALVSNIIIIRCVQQVLE